MEMKDGNSTYLTGPVLFSAKFLVDQLSNITRGNEKR